MRRNPQMYYWRKRKLFFILFFLLALLLLGALVQFLWNSILPDLLAVPALNYGQALGLLLLCRILFGSLGWNGRRGRPFYKNSPELQHKWRTMSEEEKAAFKAQWKKRCEQRNNKA